eukprot:900886-Pyramimonas_sp.AAC.1
MRLPHPVQRFVAHGELHRRPQWQSSHAPPLLSIACRGPSQTTPKAKPTTAVLTTASGWVLRQ